MRFLILVAIVFAVLLSPDATTSAFAQATTLVILVRHAEKADMSSDPELSPAGAARARALYAAVADARIDRIITTNYKRTRLTAAVAADSLGIDPIVVAVSGGLAAHVNAVADAALGDGSGGAVLVVGHSNTIPAIISALGGPQLPDIDESVYSDFFVLQIPSEGKPRLAHGRYGARN